MEIGPHESKEESDTKVGANDGAPHELEDHGPDRPAAFAALELAGVAGFLGLVANTGKGAYISLSGCVSPVLVGRMGIAVVLGILAADLGSGIVHWAADNWGSGTWPIVGPAFIQPFRHHHVDPRAITRHGFLELNGNNFIVSLPLAWVASAVLSSPNVNPDAALATASFWLSFAMFSALTNQFHSWSHMENPPRLVQVLQSARILMSRKHHHVHHIRPHDRNYCITTGWLNGPLAAIRFFEAIEWAITVTTGAVPLHESLEKG
ncbi:hypothetical protein GQ53DRAFT_127929 [Thozetella sp. PMI_491]|nr:hypothetical protein GQ53DRAFT_127929 [Thozetella sp. PMI_491]